MQAANRRKTFGLLAGMGLLTGLVAYAALTYFGSSGAAIVPFAVGIALVGVWGSYYGSDKLVLTMTGATFLVSFRSRPLFIYNSLLPIVAVLAVAGIESGDIKTFRS